MDEAADARARNEIARMRGELAALGIVVSTLLRERAGEKALAHAIAGRAEVVRTILLNSAQPERVLTGFEEALARITSPLHPSPTDD